MTIELSVLAATDRRYCTMNAEELKSYLHNLSIDELRGFAKFLGIYEKSMRRRVVLIAAILAKKATA